MPLFARLPRTVQGYLAHKKVPPLGPYSRPVARSLRWSYEEGGLLMSEVPLYRVTSLIRNRPALGPYRRPVPRVLGDSYEGGKFLMGEVPLYNTKAPEVPHLAQKKTPPHKIP